jgi:1-acyl-sn-glycerol-3-phosphate acyltransferase
MRRLIGRLFLGLHGWSLLGEPPKVPKYVLISAPHTSNWDFPFMIAISWLHGMKVHWLGKRALFRPPFGWFFRAMGGLPVDRRAAHGVVGEVAEAFNGRDKLVVAIAPEGSRGYRDHWKSGFWHIAKTAGVPLILGTLDYGGKRGGFGPTLIPGDDIHADMDTIREFYADKVGKVPEDFGPIRLREEDP